LVLELQQLSEGHDVDEKKKLLKRAGAVSEGGRLAVSLRRGGSRDVHSGMVLGRS
jgi:hypothetical protein